MLRHFFFCWGQIRSRSLILHRLFRCFGMYLMVDAWGCYPLTPTASMTQVGRRPHCSQMHDGPETVPPPSARFMKGFERFALKLSKPFKIHKRDFGKKTLSNLRGDSAAKQRTVSHCRLYEVVKSKWSCSANQYLYISHERIADDLSKWKITSIRLNRAYAWRTRVCVCVCVPVEFIGWCVCCGCVSLCSNFRWNTEVLDDKKPTWEAGQHIQSRCSVLKICRGRQRLSIWWHGCKKKRDKKRNIYRILLKILWEFGT